MYNDDNDNYHEISNQKRSLNSEQLNKLYEYVSYQLNEEPTLKALDRMTRYSNEHHVAKRDALWTTTEVLDCVRRLRHSKNISKLDLVTEMLNCYRRLKRQG